MTDDDVIYPQRLYVDQTSVSNCNETDVLFPRYQDGVAGVDPQRAGVRGSQIAAGQPVSGSP